METSNTVTARTVENFDHPDRYFPPYRHTITIDSYILTELKEHNSFGHWIIPE